MSQDKFQEIFNKQNPAIKEICELINNAVISAYPHLDCKVKWGMPHYDHKGIMCGLGAFKNHVNFFFHKGVHMKDPYKVFNGGKDNKNMYHLKFTSKEDVDLKIIIEYVEEAIRINEKGIKIDTGKTTAKKELDIPQELQDALNANSKAKQYFDNFPYYKKKEYTEWIASAKREETKQKRLKQTITQLEQGIGKEDKYR